MLELLLSLRSLLAIGAIIGAQNRTANIIEQNFVSAFGEVELFELLCANSIPMPVPMETPKLAAVFSIDAVLSNDAE